MGLGLMHYAAKDKPNSSMALLQSCMHACGVKKPVHAGNTLKCMLIISEAQ